MAFFLLDVFTTVAALIALGSCVSVLPYLTSRSGFRDQGSDKHFNVYNITFSIGTLTLKPWHMFLKHLYRVKSTFHIALC